MNRDQMLLDATRISHLAYGCGVDCADGGCLWLPADRRVASRILNALLPQISTIEEMEALPEGSILVSDEGEVREWTHFRSAEVMLKTHGTMTVVWQP